MLLVGLAALDDKRHDRGYHGQFLEYPPDYDPWTTSVDRMCDHWSEWDGMKEVVDKAGRSSESRND